jgi:hypothetical protein
MNPSSRRRNRVGYLRSVLRDGALPFTYRGGVRSLLGVPDPRASPAAPGTAAPLHFADATHSAALEWPPAAPPIDLSDAATAAPFLDAPVPLLPWTPTGGPAEPTPSIAMPAHDPRPSPAPSPTTPHRAPEHAPRGPAVGPGHASALRPEAAPPPGAALAEAAPSRAVVPDRPAAARPVAGPDPAPQVIEPTATDPGARRPTDTPAAVSPSASPEPITLLVPGVSTRPTRPPQRPTEPPAEPAASAGEAAAEPARTTGPPPAPVPATRPSRDARAARPTPVRRADVAPRGEAADQPRADAAPDEARPAAVLIPSPRGSYPASAPRSSFVGAPLGSAPNPDAELRSVTDAGALLERVRSAVQMLAPREAPRSRTEFDAPPTPSIPPPAPPVVIAPREVRSARPRLAYWARRLGHIRARILR